MVTESNLQSYTNGMHLPMVGIISRGEDIALAELTKQTITVFSSCIVKYCREFNYTQFRNVCLRNQGF